MGTSLYVGVPRFVRSLNSRRSSARSLELLAVHDPPGRLGEHMPPQFHAEIAGLEFVRPGIGRPVGLDDVLPRRTRNVDLDLSDEVGVAAAHGVVLQFLEARGGIGLGVVAGIPVVGSCHTLVTPWAGPCERS